MFDQQLPCPGCEKKLTIGQSFATSGKRCATVCDQLLKTSHAVKQRKSKLLTIGHVAQLLHGPLCEVAVIKCLKIGLYILVEEQYALVLTGFFMQVGRFSK